MYRAPARRAGWRAVQRRGCTSAQAVEHWIRGPAATLAPQVLGAPAQLLLQRGVLRALEWCHERTDRPLLVDLQLCAATLDVEHTIERRRDALLIGVRAGENLAAERHACFALLCGELAPLEIEWSARLGELRHLLVGEADAILRDAPETLTQPGFQLLPARAV